MQPRSNRFVLHASSAVALLLAAVSVGGLALPSLYARETAAWRTQAIAQDWFDLLVAAPALLLAARRAGRGSPRSRLVLGGVLLFAIYTLVIYAFAVQLNTLFLIYCAALGLALYAAITLAYTTDATTVRTLRRPRAAGALLVSVGVAFAGLWLAQLVPAAITGRPPAALAATGLPTNPVHVMDLAFILPLHVLTGVLLLRRRRLGDLLAPAVLTFDVLMASSIACLLVLTPRLA
ncbi:MAG: hypothetical protein KIT31_22860 [Deltaproteobacteria bacterium]|nr:hypothetical protein [Deltaproteobacteria bacterium]